MKKLYVKEFEIVASEDEASYFRCELSTDKMIDIDMGDLFEFATTTDKDLELQSLMFGDWEDLTEELVSTNYNIKGLLSNFVQQFTEKQLDDISRMSDSMEEEDEEDIW